MGSFRFWGGYGLMTNKKTDPLKAAKDTIKKAKGSTTANITTALDVNKDGTVDILDIIILAFKMPAYMSAEMPF